MWECKYCNKQLVLKNKFTKSGHLSKCQNWHQWKTIHLNEDYLREKYLKENLSLPDIAKELELDSVTTIVKQMNKFGIKIRSISESSPNRIKKSKKTHMKNSGYEHNFQKGYPSRLIWEAKMLNEMGVINVFQFEEVKEKIKNTYIKKYGVEFLSQVPEIRKKQLETVFKKYGVFSSLDLAQHHRYTKPHKMVVEYLNSINFEPKIEKCITCENSKYYFDIFFDNSMKLIEINGDYWHANPIYYKSLDQIKYSSTKMKIVQDIWDYDVKKIKFANDLGYQVLVIWENDLNTKKDLTFNLIKQFLEI